MLCMLGAMEREREAAAAANPKAPSLARPRTPLHSAFAVNVSSCVFVCLLTDTRTGVEQAQVQVARAG